MALSREIAKEKIIVALDVPTRAEALALVDKLHDEVGSFKIGMQLYNAEGPDIIRDIQNLGGKVFVDLKFHDIPNTVGEVSRVITGRAPFMMTLHAGGGKKMLAAAAKATNEKAESMGITAPITLAVTVLTSISQAEFEEEVGITKPIAEQVVLWAKMAKEAGITGVVASPKEITAIREACGEDFTIVTPGIRPLWAATNDQSRVMTPKEAVEAGANYLVIGRPITAQPNQVEAAKKIVAEIMEATL